MNKRLQLYDDDYCTDYGEQPDLLEINIGQNLLPLVEGDDKQDLLMQQIQRTRNNLDAEYGFLLPKVRIRDSTFIEPDEYVILISGSEVAKSSVKLGYYLCLDTGLVRTVLDDPNWENTQAPAFGMDGFIIPEKDVEKAKAAGYVCVPPERIIGTHLHEIIKSNITRLLNQAMVNELVEKVRKVNPDVITDVFIIKRFSISDMKIVLNRLLEEYISIRDMNTILETIADYLNEERNPLVLAEKVRKRLAPCFIKDYAEDGKKLHLFKISGYVSENLIDHIYYPESKIERPYLALDPADSKKLMNEGSRICSWFGEHGFDPVVVCVSQLRPVLADYLHEEKPGVHVISDLELYAAKNLITVNLEGEVTFDD